MSKKSKKPAAQRKPEQSQSKATAARTPTSRSTTTSTTHRAPSKRGPTLNLKAMRITAGVLGALLLAGLVSMIVTLMGEFSIGSIITAVVLGIFTAICAYAAIRPAEFANYLSRLPS